MAVTDRHVEGSPVVATKALANVLADSATRYAHRALDYYMDRDFGDFYLAAGVALEQALKTRLARENPAFLAPDRNFKAAVAIWKSQHDASQLPTGTITVAATEALARVVVLEPTFEAHADASRRLLRLRNGEAHLGVPGTDEVAEVLAGFLRAMNALLRVDPTSFWGEYADFVRIQVDESAGRLAQEVAARLAAARRAHEQRFGGLDPGHVDTLDELIAVQRNAAISDIDLPEDCPACGSPGLLHGTNTLDWDVEFDRDGEPIFAHPFLEFRAKVFDCEACGLSLVGEDALTVAGIRVTRTNRHADISDYLDEIETF